MPHSRRADSRDPTLSLISYSLCLGLPRGLGEPGFQRKERDIEKEKEKVKEKTRGKDKEKDKDKDRDSERELEEQPLLSRPFQAKEKDKDAEDRARPRSLHRFHLHRDHSQNGQSKEDLADPDREGTSSPQIPEHNHHPSYGWSAMLEDWLCHGGPPLAHSNLNPNPSTAQLNETPKPALLDVPISEEEFLISPKAKSTGDLALRMAPKAPAKGPYELPVKERMMGIYLAVYINRDIKGLVQGHIPPSCHYPLLSSRLIVNSRHLKRGCDSRVDRGTAGEQGCSRDKLEYRRNDISLYQRALGW